MLSGAAPAESVGHRVQRDALARDVITAVAVLYMFPTHLRLRLYSSMYLIVFRKNHALDRVVWGCAGLSRKFGCKLCDLGHGLIILTL
jgi:hypothetical protein